MMVEPPGRFSTITEIPGAASFTFCAMARAWMSVCPPGGNGTTMRTGLPGIGNCWDCAAQANASAQNATVTLVMSTPSSKGGASVADVSLC